VVGWHYTGWEIVGISLGGALLMMVILWVQEYMLYRVDQSIHIVVSSDMDIPMTYASLD
jgi:hypothetical protein